MAPITRILCPVDFSEASEHAIEHAIAVASWYQASITALHVYNPIFMPVPGLPPPGSRASESELKRMHVETTRCFEGAIASGVDVDVIVDVGPPSARILDRSETAHSDLIVMGTHGASGFEHLLLGSVTEKVLRKARRPVLTVPPHAQAISTLPFRRLLCAVDFSAWSLRGLELTCSLAKSRMRRSHCCMSLVSPGTNRRHQSLTTSRQTRLPRWLNFGGTFRRVRSGGSKR
jgi:nucleotide-binding universal stress UspA family protein